MAGTFPAAITREVDEPGQSHWVNLNKVNPTHFTNKKFREHLTAENTAINAQRASAGQPALPSECEMYDLVPANRQAQYLTGRFATIWDQYGFPNITYHWASCGAYSVTQRNVVRKSILFVRIRSASAAIADGQITYVNLDENQPILYLWGRLPEITRVSSLRVLSYNVLAVRAMLPRAAAAPPALPANSVPGLSLDGTQREVDDALLEHAVLEQGTYYIPEETNPDEMSDGEEESEDVRGQETRIGSRRAEEKEEDEQEETISEPDTPESPHSWIELDAGEISPVGEAPEGWAIYASYISPEEIQAKGITSFDRLSIGVLDDFVMDLHCHVLWLKNKIPTEPEAGSKTFLVENDEWRCWLYDVLNAKEAFILNGKKGQVGGFGVRASLSPMGGGPKEETPAWMRFSTDEAVLKKTFGLTDPITDTGILKKHAMLVMALDPVSVEPSKSVFVNDLIRFVGLEEELNENPLIQLIGSFPMKPPSSLAELEGKRNAVWFLPSNDYRTTIRLEWQMDPVTQAKLNEFIEPLNLKLGTTSAIARRTSRWSTSGPSCHMLTQGSLVFLSEVTLDKIKLDVAFEFTTTTTTLTLTLNTKTSEALQSLLNWVQPLIPDNQKIDFKDLENKSFGSASLGEFTFRRVTIQLAKDPTTGKAKLATFSMDMEVCINHSPQPPTLFLLSYAYQKGQGSTVSAKLWCRTCSPVPPRLQDLILKIRDLTF